MVVFFMCFCCTLKEAKIFFFHCVDNKVCLIYSNLIQFTVNSTSYLPTQASKISILMFFNGQILKIERQ